MVQTVPGLLGVVALLFAIALASAELRVRVHSGFFTLVVCLMGIGGFPVVRRLVDMTRSSKNVQEATIVVSALLLMCGLAAFMAYRLKKKLPKLTKNDDPDDNTKSKPLPANSSSFSLSVKVGSGAGSWSTLAMMLAVLVFGWYGALVFFHLMHLVAG